MKFWKKYRKKPLDENTVRVIKISKEALYEFLYEKFIENQEQYLDVDPLTVTNNFALDCVNGDFIFCAYKSEDAQSNLFPFPKEIDLQKVMKRIPDTTFSMFAPNSCRYKDYTKKELAELSKDDKACESKPKD